MEPRLGLATYEDNGVLRTQPTAVDSSKSTQPTFKGDTLVVWSQAYNIRLEPLSQIENPKSVLICPYMDI
jgi:hypothetical protein